MKTILFFILCSAWGTGFAQIITLDQAIEAVRRNNRALRAASYEVEYQRQVRRTSFDLPKTDVSLMYGQYNSIVKNDNNISISQTIPFTSMGSQAVLNKSLVALSEFKRAVTENELVYQVKQVYYQLGYLQARHSLLLKQDSIYTDFIKFASLRFKTGETNLLEKTTAETQGYEVKNLLDENQADVEVYRSRLQTLINSEFLPSIEVNLVDETLPAPSVDTTSLSANPSVAYRRQQVDVSLNHKKVERAKFAPDLRVGFFTQTLIGYQNVDGQDQYFGKNKRFQGFQVGLSLPLWFAPHVARIKAAGYTLKAVQSNYEYQQQSLQNELQQATQELAKNRSSLEYYKDSALPNSVLILRHSDLAFKNGEIGFTEYLVSVRNAIGIRENYLRTLNNYNQSILTIEFLLGNQNQSHDNK